MPQYFNFALNKTSIYYDDGVNYNIAAAPLYFVRSGYITLPIAAGTFRDAGIADLYWSSRSYSMSTRAYNLLFNANEVNSLRNDYARWYAFPLRCLSTVLGI